MHPSLPERPRCTCALAAAGKVRLPRALLTPRFKKLVATKQAQENRLLKPAAPRAPATATSPPPMAMAANGGGGGEGGHGGGAGGGAVVLPAPEDTEWASMAEEEGEGMNGHAADDGDASKERFDSFGGGGGGGGVEEEDEHEAASAAAGAGREHLILLCRPLLMCSTSSTERVRERAALLLADADIPGAVDALQVRLVGWLGIVVALFAPISLSHLRVVDLRFVQCRSVSV